MTPSLKEIREEIVREAVEVLRKCPSPDIPQTEDSFMNLLIARQINRGDAMDAVDELLRTKLTLYTEAILKKGIEAIEAANEGEPASEYENGFDFGMIAAAKILQSLTENTNQIKE